MEASARTPSAACLARTALVVLAVAVAAVAGSPALAQPVTVHSDLPVHSPDRKGFEHFLQSHLPVLVGGQAWEWGGREYEARRLHALPAVRVHRVRRPHRDRDPGLRGFAIAVLHVEVDGQLHRVRATVNAGYSWALSGWAWEEVVIALGGGATYDFVAGEVR